MSTTDVALTAHLVMPWPGCAPAFLEGLEGLLSERFGIAHSTVQLEPSDGRACSRGMAGTV